MKTSEPGQVYQIKVSLDRVRPPVWRRILVADNITLFDLHAVIQTVFGWQGYHLHEFRIHDILFGDPANDEFGESDLQDEMKFKLQSLKLAPGTRFKYQYDFGDSWEHTLLLEKILPFEKRMKLPQCIQGKRACPPDDVGGFMGYEGFLDALRDPQHPEHDSYIEWMGREFDPEEFDLETINLHLRQETEGIWPGSTPPSPEFHEELLKFLFDPGRLAKLSTPLNDQKAQTLALRQDVLTFLTYLKDNKVTGTQATGNLPRKAIEAIASGFTNPPGLETISGKKVFRYRNEEDVLPLFFVHGLALSADLIDGGPGQRWKLTQLGENFLALPAVVQVWILLSAWRYQVNWMIIFAFDIFGSEPLEQFSQNAISLLSALPAGKPITFASFTSQLVEAMDWTWPAVESDDILRTIVIAIQQMVVDPLENFGVLTTGRVKDTNLYPGYQPVESFSLTSFGLAMLDSL
jgi:hypothetical protein